jgi:hypothetical protein
VTGELAAKAHEVLVIGHPRKLREPLPIEVIRFFVSG